MLNFPVLILLRYAVINFEKDSKIIIYHTKQFICSHVRNRKITEYSAIRQKSKLRKSSDFSSENMNLQEKKTYAKIK